MQLRSQAVHWASRGRTDVAIGYEAVSPHGSAGICRHGDLLGRVTALLRHRDAVDRLCPARRRSAAVRPARCQQYSSAQVSQRGGWEREGGCKRADDGLEIQVMGFAAHKRHVQYGGLNTGWFTTTSAGREARNLRPFKRRPRASPRSSTAVWPHCIVFHRQKGRCS